CVGAKLKSVSSLLSRKPRPGTTIPLPPSSSIVLVHDTTLPAPSATTKWLVWCSRSGTGTAAPDGGVQLRDLLDGSAGAGGLTPAFVGSMRQARWRLKDGDSSCC